MLVNKYIDKESTMFIESFKNNGIDYLRLVHGVRTETNGHKTIRKKVILNIGPLSRHDDGLPDTSSRSTRVMMPALALPNVLLLVSWTLCFLPWG